MYEKTYQQLSSAVNMTLEGVINQGEAKRDAFIARRNRAKPARQAAFDESNPYYKLAEWMADFKQNMKKPEPKEEAPAKQGGTSTSTSMGADSTTDDYEKRLIHRESSGRTHARAKTSSATGLTQITKDTWLSLVKKHQPAWAKGMSEKQLLDARTDGDKNMEMFRHLRAENKGILKSSGLPVNNATEYAVHFLGPRAVGVLKASDDTPMEKLVPSSFIEANKSVLAGKTAGQFKAWLNKKMMA